MTGIKSLSATFFILALAVFLMSPADSFKVNKQPASAQAHKSLKPLYVVINNRNREDRKIELPPKAIKNRWGFRGSSKKKSDELFGFTTAAELLNGRTAMAFFLFGMYEEITTGKSIPQQIGLVNQGQQVNWLVLSAVCGAVALYPSVSEWITKLSGMRLTDGAEK